MNKPNYIECDGEAHSNPHIDHCMMCAPNWGRIAVCTVCPTQTEDEYGPLERPRPAYIRPSKTCRTGACRVCAKRYALK